MKDQPGTKLMGRRRLLSLGLYGSALATASVGSRQAGGLRRMLEPVMVSEAQGAPASLHFAATDGWISMPPAAAVPPYHPDDMAPAGLTTYIFGFRNVTGLSAEQVSAQKMKAQLSAPLLWADEGVDLTLRLSNLGLAIRPDLIDAHTLHWHGFRNAIPIFDGEPTSSVAVPIIRDLTYHYRPRWPGTYMYHCHFEETEHVHMGMVGPAFIRPQMTLDNPGRKFAYNHLDTEYDREFVIFLNEVWSEAHWADSHVQLPEWSDYRPDFWLLNGRVYPDTLAPNGQGTDPVTGDLIAPAGRPDLKYQPVSGLVTANAGDRVLLRFINLGFQHQTMALAGIRMRVIAKDAALLRGPLDEDLSYLANTVTIGAGESLDAIFIAPPAAAETNYLLYNRNLARLNNGGYPGYGGQMTQVRVRPAGGYPVQTEPNT